MLKPNFELCLKAKKEDIIKGDFAFQIKFDGTRSFCFIEGGKCTKLCNRSGFDRFDRFAHLKQDDFNGLNAIFDGEIVVFNARNKSELYLVNSKENWSRAVFMVFDILEKDGVDLRTLPFYSRQAILKDIFRNIKLKYFKLVNSYSDFPSLWKIVQQRDLEGIVAKKRYGKYLGFRSGNYLKIKNTKFENLLVRDYKVNPRGLTLIKGKHRIACNGIQSQAVKSCIDKNGCAFIRIEYLTKSQAGQFIQPTFKELLFAKQTDKLCENCGKPRSKNSKKWCLSCSGSLSSFEQLRKRVGVV